jgi:hypothetical protein
LAGGIAAVVLALAVAWLVFVPAADWIARHDVGSVRGAPLQAARDAARGRLLTLAAGLFAVGALVYTARNFTLSREGQVTDRYTKAIEQLGSEKLDVRIGSIYALERVARDSARDHPTVMEVLTAFVRDRSHKQREPPDHPASQDQEQSTQPDVRAAVTVVGRRDTKRDIRPINLSGANLRGADLRGADLRGADLRGADLRGADLYGADLRWADLTGADLTGANLPEALFYAADLTGANLTRANLYFASFASTKAVMAPRMGYIRLSIIRLNWLVRGRPPGESDLWLARTRLTDADLTGAALIGTAFGSARLEGARWPPDEEVPKGWKLDSSSGRLVAANIDSGPPEAN